MIEDRREVAREAESTQAWFYVVVYDLYILLCLIGKSTACYLLHQFAYMSPCIP